MFKFSQDQKTYNIAGIKIGGQPGEYPTAMIGSIFYSGDGLVKDEAEGKFNAKGAREEIRKVEELSNETGNPALLDVVGATSNALIRYIDFVAEEADIPFLIDGVSPDVRIPATEHVGEIGLENRAIYNTISPHYSEKELNVIEDSGVRAAVLLCYNPRELTIEGRMKVLNKILEVVKETKIDKILVDPSTLDIPEPGILAKTQFRIKEEHGFPVGCGAHNAVDRWMKRVEMDTREIALSIAIANVLPIVMGSDFALYGPIQKSKDMFFACSLADAYVAYQMRMEYGIKPKSKEHPLYKIFRA